MTNRPCIFGEVLFDHFPDGRRVLGGAPFNVAWHLQAFGAAPVFISRVGNDDDGNTVRRAMSEWGMDEAGLQVDPSLPTGRVRVHIERGEPEYDIVHPTAWDQIDEPDHVPRFSLFYHGSLALRSETSRENCESLRKRAAEIQAQVLVDVNLRPPWFDEAEVLRLLRGAQWVKLNGDELDRLAPGHADREQRAKGLIERHGLLGLLLTDGSRGATLLTADGIRRTTKPRAGIEMADTVGAGDAMTSVMILGLLNGWDLQSSLDRAQDFASAIVGRHGATVADPAFYKPFLRAWSESSTG